MISCMINLTGKRENKKIKNKKILITRYTKAGLKHLLLRNDYMLTTSRGSAIHILSVFAASRHNAAT